MGESEQSHHPFAGFHLSFLRLFHFLESPPMIWDLNSKQPESGIQARFINANGPSFFLEPHLLHLPPISPVSHRVQHPRTCNCKMASFRHAGAAAGAPKQTSSCGRKTWKHIINIYKTNIHVLCPRGCPRRVGVPHDVPRCIRLCHAVAECFSFLLGAACRGIPKVPTFIKLRSGSRGASLFQMWIFPRSWQSGLKGHYFSQQYQVTIKIFNKSRIIRN